MNITQRQYKQLMRLDAPHFTVHITVNLSGGDWSHIPCSILTEVG